MISINRLMEKLMLCANVHSLDMAEVNECCAMKRSMAKATCIQVTKAKPAKTLYQVDQKQTAKQTSLTSTADHDFNAVDTMHVLLRSCQKFFARASRSGSHRAGNKNHVTLSLRLTTTRKRLFVRECDMCNIL